jgi:hypothetical protein
MIKRILIGLITLIFAIPATFVVAMLTTYKHFPITHWLIIEQILIAVSCILGALLIWSGKKLGNIIASIGWLLLLIQGVSGVYAAFDPRTKEPQHTYMLIEYGIFVLFGMPILFLLIRDLLKKNA